MRTNTCHPPGGRPHAAAVPDWALRHPLAAVSDGLARLPNARDALPAFPSPAGPAASSVGPAGSPSLVDPAGFPVPPARPDPAVARHRTLDASARALALAVCVDVLLAELAAERRRRRAIVDRYEHLLDCRGRGRASERRPDGGALERVREWIRD